MKKIVLSISLIFMVSGIFAQSELPDYVKNYKKAYKAVWYDFPGEGRTSKGGGYSVSMKLLKAPPKKVALVSFFTFDPGCTKTYSTSTYVATKQISMKGNAGPLVAGIYNACIDEMIAKYKSYGMELLTPDQYLNSPDKKDYYEKFEAGHGGMQHGLNKFLQGGSTANDIYGYIEGYKVLDVVLEPQANYQKSGILKTMGYSNKVPDKTVYLGNSDDKFMNSMGYELAKKLEVDAVVFVYFTVYVPKTTKVVLQNVRMIMLGQNPLQLEEKDKKPFFYHKGVFYAGASISPETAIMDFNKKIPESDKISFEGFKELMNLVTDKIGLYLTGKEGKLNNL